MYCLLVSISSDNFVEALHEALVPAIDKVGKENIKGIGIGAPNGNIHSGTIEHAPNLPWKGIVPLAEMVAARFNLLCALTNDANAATVGEMMYGVARGMKDFIVLKSNRGMKAKLQDFNERKQNYQLLIQTCLST